MNLSKLANIFKETLSQPKVASKMSGFLADDALRSADTAFSPSNINRYAQVPRSAEQLAKIGDYQRNNLIATHAISLDKLQKANDIGGMAKPSLALFDPQNNILDDWGVPNSDYGDIHFVANRDLVKGSRKYDRDAYTDMMPMASHDISIDDNKLNDFIKQNEQTINKYSDGQDPLTAIKQGIVWYYDPTKSEFGIGDRTNSAPDFMVNTYWDKNGKNGSVTGLEEWLKDLYDDVAVDNKYYTNVDGQRLPVTAENAVKMMNDGQLQYGGGSREDGFNQGIQELLGGEEGMNQLYDIAPRLVGTKAGHEIRKLADSGMRTTSKDIGMAYARANTPYDSSDVVVSNRWLNPQYDTNRGVTLPDNVQRDIKNLRDIYDNIPTALFEAKPQRVVTGKDFNRVYVPKEKMEAYTPTIQQFMGNNNNYEIVPYDGTMGLSEKLAQYANSGTRFKDPWILGLGGAALGTGALSSLLGGNEQLS